ncbi:hypothetical protein [Streptomyces sp. NPDC017941]|uniref:hypothetical protein n=1 Tax=Streptomyces sp. NPDC017941 TaxID=3365018 RepID=UPI003797687D
MTFVQILSTSAALASVAAAAVVALASFRTSAARIWREEAEAQKERADRLAGDLNESKTRLTRIEAENARLITFLTSLAPARLAVVCLTDDSTEV